MNLSQELELLTVLCKNIKAVNLMVTSDSEAPCSQTFIAFHKGNDSVFHSAYDNITRLNSKIKEIFKVISDTNLCTVGGLTEMCRRP